MRALAGRAPLVLTLALASLARIGGQTTRVQSGRILSVVPRDGAVLVETTRGPVFLVVAWDAQIHGARDVFELANIRTGDVVEWSGDDAQSVAMVDDLRVVSGAA